MPDPAFYAENVADADAAIERLVVRARAFLRQYVRENVVRVGDVIEFKCKLRVTKEEEE